MVAAAVDRARVADARLAGHRDGFIVIEADDDVRRPSGHFGFGVDEAHRQRPRDLAVAVAHEDRAELLAALQAGDSGLHHVAVAVRNEQVVAAGVGGDDDHARRDWLRHHERRRGQLLRFAANASVLVMPQWLQVRVVGLEPIPRQQLGRPHKARDRVPV